MDLDVYVFTLIIIVAGLLSIAGALFIYRFGAVIFLLDESNNRSSHEGTIPRSGGVGIWLAFIVVGFFIVRYYSLAFIGGVTGLIGFLDDRFRLSSRKRLLFYVLAAIAAVLSLKGNLSRGPEALILLFWIIFITGTTNFYNFMDGINGMAGLTGLIGFGLIAFFAYAIAHRSDISMLGVGLASGCLGFLPFNFPRARIFMGDVGSILLGFAFASFVASLSISFSVFLCLIMFLCTFYADSLVTIFYRWRTGEHLMMSHRSHLYQYLSNELGFAHWKVSLIYGSIQLIFGLSALFAFTMGLIWQVAVFGTFCVLFLVCYKKIKNTIPGFKNGGICT